MKQPKFEWYEEDRQAICTLYTEYGEFKGIASCHPDDMDMMSEKVGCEIACSRALIESLIYERDCVIKPSIRALHQLLYSMKHSKKFNSKSYENKMLWSQLQNWKLDLDTINKMINMERQKLNHYIKTKEEFYQKIRQSRNG